MSLLWDIDEVGSRKVNVTLTVDQWEFLLLGIKDIAHNLKEGLKTIQSAEGIREAVELIAENYELVELIEAQTAVKPLTCELDDLTDFAKVGSIVNIDGALWEVV